MPKAAILIDGGYFLKRLPKFKSRREIRDAKKVASAIMQLVGSHLRQLNDVHKVENQFELLYRTFYYDAKPYEGKAHTPVDKKFLKYAETQQSLFRTALFQKLYGAPNLAVRLGEVRKDAGRSWTLRAKPQKELLSGSRTVEELEDEDFAPSLRQKGVDMRIGLDIASITLKRHATTIVLVSGDSDFVPAAKMARREGVQFILDPLWQDIPNDLYEHIDGLRSGFAKPK